MYKPSGNIFKNIFSIVKNEISGKLRPKDFSASGISAHDPNYMYDIYTREFSGMKSQNLLNYIDWARRGIPFYFFKYFDTISKRDTRIRTMQRKLKAAILMEQFTVTGEWAEGVKFAELLIEHLGVALSKFFTSAIEANETGIKRFEINYELKNGYWLPSEIRAIPNFLYLYDENTRKYSFLNVDLFDQVKLRSNLTAFPDRIDISKFPQVEVHPLKILDVHAIDGDHDNAFMNGIAIALSFANYCKNYNVKDMNIFLERWASPTTKMKYDPLNAQSKDELVKAADGAKTHGTYIYPDGTEIDLLNDSQKGQAGNLYLSAISYWNSEITILYSGEEETTQMGEKGSLAALKVKEKISELILQMNLKTCENAFSSLLHRLIVINFSSPGKLPHFNYIKISTLEDKKLQSEINKNLKDISVLPTHEALEEQFGVDLEDVETPEQPNEEDIDDNDEEKIDGNEDEEAEENTYESNYLEKIFFEAGKEAAK